MILHDCNISEEFPITILILITLIINALPLPSVSINHIIIFLYYPHYHLYIIIIFIYIFIFIIFILLIFHFLGGVFGSDFLAIFPVISWLIKMFYARKEERTHGHRKYALMKYSKIFHKNGKDFYHRGRHCVTSAGNDQNDYSNSQIKTNKNQNQNQNQSQNDVRTAGV